VKIALTEATAGECNKIAKNHHLLSLAKYYEPRRYY
jgi:hypothetical protein